MRGSRLWLLAPLILLLSTRAQHCEAQAARGSCRVGSKQQLVADCIWSPEGPPAASLDVAGALGRRATPRGPPALIRAASAGGTGPSSGSFVHVILAGFQLPAPSSNLQALIPAGLLGLPAAGSGNSLSLQDVRILVDAPTLPQHVEFFTALASVTTYTDGQSFLHVNYYSTGTVSWTSVGLLLADSVEDARRTSLVQELPASSLTARAGVPASIMDSSNTTTNSSSSDSSSRRGRMLRAVAGSSSSSSSTATTAAGYNYVLAADQQSVVWQLQRLGEEESPVGCLVYLESNVTLSKPPVPEGGIKMARPMFLVGLSFVNVSIDWHMQVNQIIMNYTYSNITFDSVAIENLGLGDAKSAEVARPLSVSSANNFWPLYYNRSEDRLWMKNMTVVFGSQADLDYYMFWATVYHSQLPYFKAQAKFIHDVIQIREWKVGWQTDTSIEVIRCYSGSCRVEDTLFQLAPVLAPRMPLPAQPGPADLKLRPSERSPLVSAVGTPTAFKDQLMPLTGPEAGRPHVILLRTNISLQPLFGSGNSSSGGGGSANASTPAGAYVPPGVPPTGVPVTASLSIVGDLSNEEGVGPGATHLDLAFARGLLSVPSQDSGPKGQLRVQHVRLRGLAQGPGAAQATSLQAPDAWTLLGWAFRRSANDDVELSGCTLELPPPEFDRLAVLARTGGGQVVLRLSGDVRASGGDGLVVLTGVMDRPADSSRRRLLSSLLDSSSSGSSTRRLLEQQDSRALLVEGLSAQGLSGSKLVLVPGEAAEGAPWGYHWPGGAAPVDARAGLSGPALAAAIAVPVVVGGLLAAAAAFAVVTRSRRRRRQQLAGGDKDTSGPGPQRRASSRSTQGSSFGSHGHICGSNKRAAFAAAASSQCCSLHGDNQQCLFSGDAAVAVSSARPSWDIAAGQDQACSAAACSSGRGAAEPVGSSQHPAGGALLGPTNTTVDSAQSFVKEGQGIKEDSAQQMEAPGLSARLTSAISNLQRDITRRRIGGLQQQAPGGSSDKRGSSGHVEPAAAAASTAAPSGDGRSSKEPAATAAAPLVQRACSLAAIRTNPGVPESVAVAMGAGSTTPADLQIVALIGRGSFASVYRAIWRGRCVALKVVQLPAAAGGDDELGTAEQTRERMAVMEAVVSVTMSHPNVVQVYTFGLQPLLAQEARSSDGASSAVGGKQQPVGWELNLYMELCEEGSLRTALNQQRLVDPSSQFRVPAVHLVLALAHDVACAMLHLHSEQIVHSDLKASNVLLTKANTFAPFTAALGDSSSGSRPRPDSCAAMLAKAQALAGGRLVAKVADFGLSLALDPESTHISHMHAGTLTHMAPELLLHGRASKASDVYAFAILLWELTTGLRAFQGMPVALVGHNVTQLGLRPPWVPGVSPALKQLVEECWAQNPDDRPSFSSILLRLEQMLQQSPAELCMPAQGAASSSAASTQQQTAAGAHALLPSPGQQLQQARQLLLQQQQQALGAGAAGGGAAAAAPAAQLQQQQQGASGGTDNESAVMGDWTM